MKCRLCGKGLVGGSYLERVNEKGVTGIWEHRPVCDADLPQDVLLFMALEPLPNKPEDVV